MLDSNTDYQAGSPQYEWLMSHLEKDREGFLFIAFHHPPYTQYQLYAKRKAEQFLAQIFEQGPAEGRLKPDLVLGGHTHNYERYRYGDVNYVVSGGGGALQHPVERRADDFYTEPGETYHFCKITVFENKAQFEMVRYDAKNRTWSVSDSFELEAK